MILCLFFFLLLPFPMPITTHKKKGLYEKTEHIFQDQAFGHRVAFKCLHKGLQPFTRAGLHNRGVWLLGDDWWGGHVYPNQFLCAQHSTLKDLYT
jgi:hypothetical protein